jgi:hypothetical protein
MVICLLAFLAASGEIPGLNHTMPPGEPVRLGKPMSWAIQEVRPPKVAMNADEWRGTVLGKPVVIRPGVGESVDGVERGRDGSLHVRRARRQIAWTAWSTIWWDGKETMAEGNIHVYRDRKNYIGAITETSAVGMPMSAPQAYLVRDGRRTDLGPGVAVAWEPDGLIVLSVPVDDQGRPAGYESTVDSVTRLVFGERQLAVSGFGYLGRTPDGSILMGSSTGYGTSDSGFVYGAQGDSESDDVLWVKNGKLTRRLPLPKGWRIVGASPAGWLLVRKWPIRKVPDTSKARTAEEVFRQQEQMAEEAVDDELVWEMGRLEGNLLRPIRFARPRGTAGLFWRDSFVGRDSVTIHTFFGSMDRWFRLSPR